MTNRWGDVYTASNAEARLLLWDGTLLFPNKIMQLRPEWPWIFRSMCTYLHPYHIYLHVFYISSLSLQPISLHFLYIIFTTATYIFMFLIYYIFHYHLYLYVSYHFITAISLLILYVYDTHICIITSFIKRQVLQA